MNTRKTCGGGGGRVACTVKCRGRKQRRMWRRNRGERSRKGRRRAERRSGRRITARASIR
jgi:hypothetical protein